MMRPLHRVTKALSALPVATKLSASFCLIVLLLMGSITIYNVLRARQRDLEDEQETMQSLAAATAGRLDQFIIDSKQLTEGLASNLDVVALLHLPLAALHEKNPRAFPGLSDEDRRVIERVHTTVGDIFNSAKRDHDVSPDDQAVFVNVYASDGAKFESEDSAEKRAERTGRLNFHNAAIHPTVVDVSSVHVGESRAGASFFHLTKAALEDEGRQLGTVTFAIDADLLGYMVPDLGAVPEFGSDAARAKQNPDGRPTAITRCTPPGQRPGAREVFLVDRFGAVLLPNACAGKNRFLFLDPSGRDAALHAGNADYDFPFRGKTIDGTEESSPLFRKLQSAIAHEQRIWGGSGKNDLWNDETERRQRFAAVVPWNGRQRIVGIHPVREARAHGWHVVYTEDIDDAFGPLQTEHRNIFLGMLAAVVLGAALMVGIVSFLMRQTKELHAGTWALTHGALDTRIRVLSGDELGQLAESFNTMAGQIGAAADKLEARNKLIRAAFGRYLTDEVVETLLASPEGLALGGESRTVTILMSDLRGFSSISEHLAPKQVVSLLNHYLQAMTEVIVSHGGTIDEFIGDAILVLFGAPIARDDHAARAVACAVEMQLAMDGVREQNRKENLPKVEMGVGVHTGEVVVGNIGSDRRAKYGVVGKPVNLATRIEALTVGGQVLISKATLDAAGPGVHVGEEMHVSLKGVQNAMSIYEVHGFSAAREMSLPPPTVGFVELSEALVVRYVAFDGVHSPSPMRDARITALSLTQAVLEGATALDLRSTVKIQFSDGENGFIPADAYAKVLRAREGGYVVHFTSMPREIQQLVASAAPAGGM